MTTIDDARGDGPGGEPLPFEEWDHPREAWLLSGICRVHRQRSLLLEMTTRALFSTVLVFSLYLLLVGHYGPGGGFAAGLVAGLAFVLRHIAGGSDDLGAAVRVRPPVVYGVGLTIALLSALAPVAFGAPVLSTAPLAVDVPLLGHLETQTSLFLDIGVYLLLIGVVLDLLRSLGAGIERDMHDAGEAR
ncbi:MnhB domain-containing protein [Pseudonocardia sp. MH-G8]|uniref:MnhB domain-containing protein n=1 Tax=Pseudonocardia sp. MH-G8 TaxID=1854588 RepID=UPI000BA126B2|nr:MnhB domain-containing protein [Pseudonocardia sp. MH-G8]OZM78440.1 cation transporter [Pseudonocardia sp. MH-G8]